MVGGYPANGDSMFLRNVGILITLLEFKDGVLYSKEVLSICVHSQVFPQLGKTLLVNTFMFGEVSLQYKFLLINHYGRNPVSEDSVSAVSVMRGLPRPEKKWKIK
jgi:hypothetical protein